MLWENLCLFFVGVNLGGKNKYFNIIQLLNGFLFEDKFNKLQSYWFKTLYFIVKIPSKFWSFSLIENFHNKQNAINFT